MASKKRGRPKSTPRPAIDLGTPELQRHRMYISPTDATQSTNPLDALLARGVIDADAHAAARYWAALRKMVFGKATPGAIDLLSVSNGRPDELSNPQAEDKYRDACRAMSRFSRQVFDAVENIVVHERWPQWMFVTRSNLKSRAHCMTGLGALTAWHKGRR